MKKPFSENATFQLLFLSAIVLLSRIPFLWSGFGAEEDSWLLALTAKNIALGGSYEMSREPGHPLQELMYALMYNNSLFAFTTNLISAVASVISTVFFALSLRNLGIRQYLFAAFAFAFTPVVFVSSTYTIDYMLAMAFVMGSFYFLASPPAPLLQERGGRTIVLPGIFLGIAIGFRLTSAAMLIPFCILLLPFSKEGLRRMLLFAGTTMLIGLITYIPVLKTYGLSFFTYSDQFPYPNLPKILYKATFGVFGTVGLITILLFKGSILIRKFRRNEKMVPAEIPMKLFWASLAVIVVYLISYLRLPQKSAYLIPIVPFIILLFAYYLSGRAFRVFCVLMALSSFLCSINLTDPLRGSVHSALAVKFHRSGQEIFIDPLSGPIFSDYTKRLNKIAFTEEVFQRIRSEQRKIVLICGWWYNQLMVRGWGNEPNTNVIPVFYIDKASIEKHMVNGYEIYFLPEQDLYNDQYSQMSYTNSVAKPY